jgi:23S rRNA U2552 (ribose-2'-O)-methylase RlmE/FtsJ
MDLYNIKTDHPYEYVTLQIKTTSDDLPENPNELYGYNNQLNVKRDCIDKIDSDVWKKIRWYINEYDFLVKDPIINRAFYKYWEIINKFNIFEHFDDNHDIIFHGAEAPGGFIQGSNIYLQLENNSIQVKENVRTTLIDSDGFTQVASKKRKNVKDYKIYTMSLNKDLAQYKSYNLPNYNKNIINKYVYVTYGKDNSGDINNLDNIEYIKSIMESKQQKQKQPFGFYLITMDGGFDEGTDFNNKEQLHYLLILNEILSTIMLQKRDGNCIIKVFDIFTHTSIHLLYLLNLFYDEVYIYKPKTSRPTNSEKYVICKKFKRIDNFDDVILELQQLSCFLKHQNKKYASFTLFDTIPEEFINKIRHVNEEMLNLQNEFLSNAITLCEDDGFICKYDQELYVSLERRREVYRHWEVIYNLDSFIP